MKICVVCDYIGPAKDSMGAERMIEALVRSFTNMGHDVIMKVNPASTNMPAPVVAEIPTDCDIINFNGWDPATSQQEFDSYGIPWVVTLHGGGSETAPLWCQTIRNPHTICVSKFVADRVGTKAYAWSCSSPDDFIFEEKKDNYFLWMGGTDWGNGKGLFDAIQLAKKLKFKLKIAGTGQNKQVIEHIKSQCDNNIEYVGSVNGKEKAQLLSKAKAFLLLTRLNDACPLTFSETMLSGTPIIAYPNGSLPELMDDKVGILCGSEPEVAKAILKIRKIKPKNCYEYGLENFSNIAVGKKYIEFYKQMIEKGSLL